jgi:hypothetical protein
MKKKDLARLLDQAKRSIETMQHRARNDQAERRRAFEEAMASLRRPGDVRLITPTGQVVMAKVLDLNWDQTQVEMANREGWREFVPGMSSVEIRLAPYPG